MKAQVLTLLENSDEPSVRYIYKRHYLGLSETNAEIIKIKEDVKNSSRVQAMLSARDVSGRFPRHAYQKWKGPFWTFLVLADIGYPAGDETLIPLREQIYEWLLDSLRLEKTPLINGKYRRCACQEGGAVFSIIRLGLVDSRIEQLVEYLLKWQWPDGGWNCDKKPDANHSSFCETLIPLRGLNAFYKISDDNRVKESINRAAEVFLSRRLYKRITTGDPVSLPITDLSYPAFWHYDILSALKAMDEAGYLQDPRCSEALDLLESMQLADGGFPAIKKYYKVTSEFITGSSFVQWGKTGKTQMNEFVTAEAISVLKKAGRM